MPSLMPFNLDENQVVVSRETPPTTGYQVVIVALSIAFTSHRPTSPVRRETSNRTQRRTKAVP